MQKLLLGILVISILALAISSPFVTATEDPYYPDPAPKDRWVDSLMDAMSLEQKIAQLIMVRANLNGVMLEQVLDDVAKYQVGGIVFFKGNPTEQIAITQRLQSLANIPLFVAIDGEWGLGMRIDSAWSFPKQMTIGAIYNHNRIYEMGAEIARQCRRMGIHINFAPVADVNSNPNNPVINMRSFGESPASVAEKSIAYMRGLQDHGVMAVAKHFPGHGDTDKDSHHTLPKVNASKDYIDRFMLPPFKALIDAGVSGVMTAHIEVPALDKKAKMPISLSEEGIHRLLQRKLGFKGLVFTDALEMKGVANYVPSGEVEVQALLAGSDILLLPLDVSKAIASVLKAVQQGRISERQIDRKCRKVLQAKRMYQVDQVLPLASGDLEHVLNPPICTTLSANIYEEAITVVENNNRVLPLEASSKFMATLAINTTDRTVFQQTLDLYARFDHFNIGSKTSKQDRDDILGSLSDYPTILLSLHGLNDWPQRNFGLDSNTLNLIRELQSRYKVILTVFGNPYAIGKLGELKDIDGLVVAYEDHPLAQQAAAQVIMGALPAAGQLPVTTGNYPLGHAIVYPAKEILVHTTPLAAGVDPRFFRNIDSLARLGIEEKAYPGCQILAAKDGKIFYHKSFGYQDYDNSMPISTGEIYDLASVTKILATTLAVMHLYEKGKINIDLTLGHYLPELKGSNKDKLTIREVMAHQAGLKAWIPYHQEIIKRREKDPGIISPSLGPSHKTRMAAGMYLRDDYRDSLWTEIIRSPLQAEKKYLYSDLGMIILQRIIENLSGEGLDMYLNTHFYGPMGLAHTAFNPGSQFCLNNVVPTEEDTLFRKMILRGDIHDPTAALLGGIAGHAGLFSNAMDVAIIMQMLLNQGSYGGKQYLRPETVVEFTRQQFSQNKNRRALGFDRSSEAANGPVCKEASTRSYGHSGFTGTYAWADPENGLVYVFLSNRTWPNAGENKLAKMNLRQQIHSLFYQSIRGE